MIILKLSINFCLVLILLLETLIVISTNGVSINNLNNHNNNGSDVIISEIFIEAYHFHTYFLQWDQQSQDEALRLRERIQREIDDGTLKECQLNIVNFAPRGPHLIAQFETCCNVTSVPAALSLFVQNHGNLSVLLHPLTRWELLDHTDRAMFLGPVIPMNTSILSIDLFDDVDNCSGDEMEEIDPELLIL